MSPTLAAWSCLVAVSSVLSGAADPEPVLRISDPRIAESSGLVELDNGLLVTTNDSGDTGILYLLDDSGDTVGVRRYGDAFDVEALAPAGNGAVWVGDIGDNNRVRDEVVVHRVPVGPGDVTVSPQSYRLRYPDGARDAETLLADSRTGRLFLVSKTVLASTVYAAPERLDENRVNPLTAVATLPITPTDGAVLPDGQRVLLRGYEGAVLFRFPGFERLGDLALPPQPQGESLSVSGAGRILVGSEGHNSAVYEVALPADLERAGAPSPSISGSPQAADQSRNGQTAPMNEDATWDPKLIFGSVFTAVAVAAVAMVGIRRRRR